MKDRTPNISNNSIYKNMGKNQEMILVKSNSLMKLLEKCSIIISNATFYITKEIIQGVTLALPEIHIDNEQKINLFNYKQST